MRDLLIAMDLQQGIRFGSQCQTAKVFIVTLDQLLAQHAARPLATGAQSPPGGSGRRLPRSGSRGKGKGGGVAKGVMTKRERAAFDELARDGLVGLGAVDPSPQRTAVATAAALSLLLAERRP